MRPTRIHFPFFMLLAMLGFSLWLLCGETVKTLLLAKQSWETALSSGDVSIAIGAEQTKRTSWGAQGPVRDIKFSLPLRSVVRGCESIYGAAIAKDDTKTIVGRYLIRFKYNLRKSSCVSTDLSFDMRFMPRSLELELVETSAAGEVLEEKPRNDLFVLRSSGTREEPKFEFATEPFSGGAEYVAANAAIKNERFSWNPKAGDLRFFTMPDDDLKQWLIDQFHARIALCKSSNRCDPIVGAVARITDPDIIAVIGEAQQAGIPVSLITNPSSPFFPTGEPWPKGALPPWNWLRGNQFKINTGEHLPMHTRFIVFGNDLVLSGNSNFAFAKYYTSREFAVAYKGREPAKIFKEIFSIIRSGLFYPVSVDLRDSAVILLNADRQRGYAASRLRPYLQISTNENIRSSAYGIMYELLRRDPNSLTLAMSPLSNSCAVYHNRLCLREILQQYQEKGLLRLILNGYFYLAPDELAADAESPDKIYWDASDWQSRMTGVLPFFNAFRLSPPGISFKMLLDGPWASHHERVGILNHETFISGSANFAQPSTLNTIELLKDPAIACNAEAELRSGDEPYFIVRKTAASKAYRTYGDCEFLYERSSDVTTPPAPKAISAGALEQAYNRRYGTQAKARSIVLPEDAAAPFINRETLLHAHYKEQPLAGDITSASSYVCVGNSEGKFLPVRIPDPACAQ